MKAQITTPVQGYNGISACVSFVDGYAETEIDESQLHYFQSAGYKVSVVEDKPNKIQSQGTQEKKPKKAEK